MLWKNTKEIEQNLAYKSAAFLNDNDVGVRKERLLCSSDEHVLKHLIQQETLWMIASSSS